MRAVVNPCFSLNSQRHCWKPLTETLSERDTERIERVLADLHGRFARSVSLPGNLAGGDDGVVGQAVAVRGEGVALLEEAVEIAEVFKSAVGGDIDDFF